MAINPILNSSAQGLERSLNNMDEAAARIASRSASDSIPASREAGQGSSADVAKVHSGGAPELEAVASLTLYARQVQAAAKVVETADATMGFLLDVHA